MESAVVDLLPLCTLLFELICMLPFEVTTAAIPLAVTATTAIPLAVVASIHLAVVTAISLEATTAIPLEATYCFDMMLSGPTSVVSFFLGNRTLEEFCNTFSDNLMASYMYHGAEYCAWICFSNAYNTEMLTFSLKTGVPAIVDLWKCMSTENFLKVFLKAGSGLLLLGNLTPFAPALAGVVVNNLVQITLASMLGSSVSSLGLHSWLLVKAGGCLFGGSYMLVAAWKPETFKEIKLEDYLGYIFQG